MRILIAEDDSTSRMLLEVTLKRWGHEVLAVQDGIEAWEVLKSEDAPRLAILDWMMPGVDGSQICRRVRERDWAPYTYIILLTAKDRKEDVVTGLDTGADDYVTKPFNPRELRSRIRAGTRILDLEAALREKVREVQEAMSHVRQLQGLLPICMHCKKIRDDGDTWRKMESYIEAHTGALFSHSLCGDCLREHYPEIADEREAPV